MRAINISNDKKRDAIVGFEGKTKKPSVKMVLPDGSERTNVKFVKTTVSAAELAKKYGDLNAAGKALIEGDPETDREVVGKLIGKTRKLYVTQDGGIAYRVNLTQALYKPDGIERERRDLAKAPANIAAEIPLQWTGKQFPKDEAIRKFVFTKNYQIRHTNGLSYDFLYGMAKQLAESNTLMFVGAGKKGNEPIILSAGGDPYRGFLEGRVEGDKYLLTLHLTNMELKPITGGAK
ncbi:hypothetical protein AGMMS50293_03990 [Spirochaetia bacterium]|nr:hypothetical protein AGMMS50293_03990 [Spirochaetia bacterium]